MSHAMRPSWIVALILTSSLPAPAFAADVEESANVYQSVLKSVVWIHSARDKGKVASGTGTLIDKAHRLVLTNFHVVGTNDRVTVLFPSFRGTKLIAEREFYLDRLRREGGIRGRVIVRSRTHDLAIVQLESVPDGVQAMPLAAESVTPGQSVHSVGNPGDSGALWVYTPGKVRQVYHKKWKAQLGDETVSFEADVVETDSATNPGDSGGPLVNDKAQLVGVSHGGSVSARLLSTFIDVSEVKLLLTSRAIKDLGGRHLAAAGEGAAVFEVRDKGKFFSEEAIKKANDDIREIARKYDREILVETFPTPPESKLEQVKAMKKDERTKFFKEWAHERIKAENVNGLYVLVSREPAHLYVDVAGARARAVLDEAYTKQIIAKLLSQFRDKEFDKGLATAVEMVRGPGWPIRSRTPEAAAKGRMATKKHEKARKRTRTGEVR